VEHDERCAVAGTRRRATRHEFWRLVPSPESIGVLIGEYGTADGAAFLISRLDALRSGDRTLLVLQPTPSMTPERVAGLAAASQRTVHVVAPRAWRRDHGIRDLSELGHRCGRDVVASWYEDGTTAIEQALSSAVEHDVVGLLWPITSASEAWRQARDIVRVRASVLAAVER
jgi:hypothetical protein